MIILFKNATLKCRCQSKASTKRTNIRGIPLAVTFVRQIHADVVSVVLRQSLHPFHKRELLDRTHPDHRPGGLIVAIDTTPLHPPPPPTTAKHGAMAGSLVTRNIRKIQHRTAIAVGCEETLNDDVVWQKKPGQPGLAR